MHVTNLSQNPSLLMFANTETLVAEFVDILPSLMSCSMFSLLENFVTTRPDVTLSHAQYGNDFYLGCSVNILSSPTQRLRSFVENEGAPYRFVVVGQLSSFKVVEDAVRALSFLPNFSILT
jgi:hypothetical protein